MDPILQQQNLILFEGADIMAGLLAGDMNKRISHMYFEYENTAGAPVAPTITRADGRSYFASKTGAANKDWVRAPLVMNPSISVIPTGSASYKGNGALFTATTASVTPANGIANAANYFASSGANGPSKITTAALVSAVNPNSNVEDLVFSRLNLSAAISLQPSSHVVFFWNVKFN